MSPRRTLRVSRTRVALLLAGSFALAGCGGGPAATVSSAPGTEAQPREVNIVAKDFLFLPSALEVHPGETLLVHVVNGGLALHEVVIGDAGVQQAWEVAEAATVDAPPGPTPVVSVPPEATGVRAVVASGQRIDLRWTVPAAPLVQGLVVGCHIPGHWAKGMQIPVVLAAAR